jgi:hypothetical protein
MADTEVHRDLALTMPLMAGPDIKALQRAVNEIARRFPRILEFQLVEDGELGEQTLHATTRAAHAMGVIRSRLNEIEKRHVIVRRVQLVLRRPASRIGAGRTT